MTQSALDEALNIVTGPRQSKYGPPEAFFYRWSRAADFVLGVQVTPEQLAQLMVLLKMIRQSVSPQWDNLVDQAGYTEIAGRIMTCGKEEICEY